MYSDRKNGLIGLLILILTFCSLVFIVSVLCDAAPPDEVAVDFATATMVKGAAPAPAPSPYDCPTCKDTGWIMHGDGHQTKCPNCDLAGLPGGPFDIIRQAKELIRRGNELAERGKALLDTFEKGGKITIDIRLPKKTQQPLIEKPKQPLIEKSQPTVLSSDCADGQCSFPISRPVKTRKKSSWRWKR